MKRKKNQKMMLRDALRKEDPSTRLRSNMPTMTHKKSVRNSADTNFLGTEREKEKEMTMVIQPKTSFPTSKDLTSNSWRMNLERLVLILSR